MEEWKKIYCTNINPRKAGMDMLISDKVDFRAKKITRYREVHWKVKVLITQSCLIFWDPMDCSPPGSSCPGKNTWVVGHSLLQGIFPTQGSNPGSFIAGRFFTIWASRYTQEVHCCYSVSQSCLTLCNPMDCSMPDFPVLHPLPELAQTHVHWVGDAIQLSHPVVLFFSALNFSQHQVFFQWVSALHQVAKLLGLQLHHRSFQRILRLDIIYNWLVWSCNSRDSQESSSMSQFKSINLSLLSLFYGPIFTSIHDYWKRHSFD